MFDFPFRAVYSVGLVTGFIILQAVDQERCLRICHGKLLRGALRGVWQGSTSKEKERERKKAEELSGQHRGASIRNLVFGQGPKTWVTLLETCCCSLSRREQRGKPLEYCLIFTRSPMLQFRLSAEPSWCSWCSWFVASRMRRDITLNLQRSIGKFVQQSVSVF
ncbi:hypothetical protein BDW69DRAFT_175421 [Aspergillus filifer]